MAGVVAAKHRRHRASHPVVASAQYRQEISEKARLDDLFDRHDASGTRQLNFDQLRALLQEMLIESARGDCSTNGYFHTFVMNEYVRLRVRRQRLSCCGTKAAKCLRSGGELRASYGSEWRPGKAGTPKHDRSLSTR